MNLNTLWFILICFFYSAFFFLEGFDFGVGMLVPFFGKNDTERRALINTIGPHWDGNEVWLVVAGGATFAVFPIWYGTMFSGFYIGMFLLLLALIFRGVAFEFRSKVSNPKWRNSWDITIAISSFFASFLLGLIFTNLVRGVPIDSNQIFTGTFWTLLNPLSILGGFATAGLFLLNGTNFLTLKLLDQLQQRFALLGKRLWIFVFVVLVMFLVFLTLNAPSFIEKSPFSFILPALVILLLVLSRVLMSWKKDGFSFVLTGFSIVILVAGLFFALYPNVMISSTSPAFHLTIYNSAASSYAMRIMTIFSLIAVPVIIAYQVWTYRVFRKRIKADPEKLVY